MILAIQTWDLHLESCHSLKEKRSVIKPITSALRRSFNISVAETAHHDLWQRAEIACAALGTDRTVVTETLRAADQLVEEADGIRIVDTATHYR